MKMFTLLLLFKANIKQYNSRNVLCFCVKGIKDLFPLVMTSPEFISSLPWLLSLWLCYWYSFRFCSIPCWCDSSSFPSTVSCWVTMGRKLVFICSLVNILVPVDSLRQIISQVMKVILHLWTPCYPPAANLGISVLSSLWEKCCFILIGMLLRC